MIKNKLTNSHFKVSLSIAIVFHLVILLFVKKPTFEQSLSELEAKNSPRSLKVDHIDLVSREEVDRLKKIGIKNGKKLDKFMPDFTDPNLFKRPPPLSLANLGTGSSPVDAPMNKTNQALKNLAVEKSPSNNKSSSPLDNISINANTSNADNSSHFFFNPKKEKKIVESQEQNLLKEEAFRGSPLKLQSPISNKLSNFEIRYERPEGVSESELNSDEKAFYSFFKRSYSNYLNKLFSTYEKVVIEKPGLARDFEKKHLLIGRIDYDEKGNIILVKILKSSESDNVHVFFEETLKQLNLPNPPKTFTKGKKQFTTYYQIQIN